MPQRYNNTSKTTHEVPSVYVFTTTAQMEAYGKDTDVPIANKSLAVLLGNAAAYDQAIALWAWDSASTASAGATVIKPTNITTGRWRKP